LEARKRRQDQVKQIFVIEQMFRNLHFQIRIFLDAARGRDKGSKRQEAEKQMLIGQD
jgi:hypothetical protein